MSAAIAFETMTHRPFSRDPKFAGDIDEPCSSISAQARRNVGSNVSSNVRSNVSGAGQTDNVIFVNFLPATHTRLRLTRRGRRVIAAIVALPIVMAAFAFALNSGGAVATAETSTNTFSYITVESGQSLWQLAQTLAPTADPRDVIAEIVSLNQIQGEIQPGQRLAIPAGY